MIMDWRNVKDVSIGGKAASKVYLDNRLIWQKMSIISIDHLLIYAPEPLHLGLNEVQVGVGPEGSLDDLEMSLDWNGILIDTEKGIWIDHISGTPFPEYYYMLKCYVDVTEMDESLIHVAYLQVTAKSKSTGYSVVSDKIVPVQPEPIPTGNAKFVSTTIKPGNNNNVWTDGTYLYYSTSGSAHWRYDKTSNTWESISIPGCSETSNASNAIWGFDGRVFYQKSYELNKESMTWEPVSFSGNTGTFYGYQTWTDGENVYHTGATSTGSTYILNKDTLTWSKVTSITQTVEGRYFWTDGENIYYSKGSTNYIFDKETKTLSTITWNRTSTNSGNKMWTDGRDIFMSDSSTHWILDKENRQWNIKTWSGISPSSGGQYIYCMNPLKNAQAKCRCSTFGTDRTFNALVDKVIYTGTAAEITYVE